MKKFLLAYSFFLLQIASCNFGIEAQPEATKLSIQNNSGVHLLDVRWRGINFENIGLGGVSEKEVSDGSSFVFFNAGNGKEYRTLSLVIGEKYKSNKFSFVDNTPIREASNLNSNPFPLSDLNAD